MTHLSTGRLPSDRHLLLIPQVEQQVSTNPCKRNVLFLKPKDVTTQNGEVFTPNLMTLSKLRRTEQFKKDVMFFDNMSGNDVRCRLEENFPELINKRFSCAARENKDSSRLVFHGDRRVWDGITIRRKLRGASAMYIVLEDMISQVHATVTSGGTTDYPGTAVSGNHDTITDAVPPDLKGVNPGRFDMDWKDLTDVLKELQGNCHSETSQIAPHFAVTQEQNKLFQVPATATQRYETGYSSADSSSQDQELNQGTAVTNDNNRNLLELYHLPDPAARTRESRTVYSSEEGSSSQDQELRKKTGITINPKSGPLQGGTAVRIDDIPFDGPVMLIFGTKEVATCPYALPHNGTYTWLAATPAGDKLGEVTVTAIAATDTRDYLGETIFTYKPDDETEKKANEERVSNGNKELKRLGDLVNEMGRVIKVLKTDDCSRGNGSLDSQQQGSPNRATQLQLQDILKPLVYAAVETGARELIDVLFSLSAGKIVFEAYKNECPLPENIAEDNGHKEIAAYLRGITKRYSDEDGTSPGQPNDIDWLALANAFEEINLVPSETGYSGDGETSSSGSERESSSDSDDEYKRIVVCKGNPVSVVHEECEVLLESSILHFEAKSSCSSLLELQRTTSEDEELMERMGKAGYFSAEEKRNDCRYLESVADYNSVDNNSVEEEKEGETQHANESYLESGSCCAGTVRPSCDSLELPGSDLEEKLQRTSDQEMLEPMRKAGHLRGKDLQYLGGGADRNSEYSNTEERKKEDKLQHGCESLLEGECCYTSVKGPPCDSLEPLRNADSDDKIQGKPDQEMEFGNFLDSVRKFMKETGQHTQKVNGMLDNLKKMEQDFQDVQKYNKDQTIENACILVLYNNYIALICSTAALSKAVSEMKPMESKLPKSLQPKVKEIRSYFKAMEEKIEEIDLVVKEIGAKITEFRKKKNKITEEEKMEMEMLIVDLEGDLEIAEMYLKKAEEELQSLQADLYSYLIKEGLLASGTTTVVAGTGAAVGAGGALAYSCTTGQAIVVEKAAAIAGAVTGGVAIAYQVYSIYCKYEERKTEVNELSKELKIITAKMEAQKIEFDDKTKKKVDLLFKRQKSGEIRENILNILF